MAEGEETPVVEHRDELVAYLESGCKPKIACTAVNDIFVHDAWGKASNIGDKITMLADGSGTFAKAVGLDLDLDEAGLGLRSQRYAMLVVDGTVKALNIEEEAGVADKSSAETMLEAL